MLYGDKQEVIELYREALYKAVFLAWDVVKPSVCNTVAQESLKVIANKAIDEECSNLNVTHSLYPLHGKPDPKLPNSLLDAVCAAYGKPVLDRKRADILRVLKANVELAFNSIPRTKKDLQNKHPDLFPKKRQRKKRAP
jgi:hypothetical protein